MIDAKIVFLGGFTRGGTNVTWNLLQSHPNLCSPMLETGEVLFPGSRLGRVLRRRKLMRATDTRSAASHQLAAEVHAALEEHKRRNFGDPDNGEKAPGEPYTRVEVEASVLCIKSLDRDVALDRFFAAHYAQPYFIGIVRNGYALCNGWMRRGLTARAAGRRYAAIGGHMLASSRTLPRYRIVTFEDVLARPLEVAEELLRFVDVQPTRLDSVRLKAKRVLAADGAHATRFGAEGHKSWLGPEELSAALSSDVNTHQADQLSAADRSAFESAAGPVLAELGYA